MARKPQVHDEYIDSNQSTHCQTNVLLFVSVCKHSLLPKGLIPVRYVIDSDASDTVFNTKMHSKYQIDKIKTQKVN